jgi:hypothetical protein
MKTKIVLFLVLSLPVMMSNYIAIAQTRRTNPDIVEDATLGIRPTLKIESLSPAGHCDKQELSFFAPWADRYEIARRRIDTAWIKDDKYTNTWFSEPLKPHVTSIIFTRLDEHGVYEFVVKAFKGNRYLKSQVMTRGACAEIDHQQ